jgi:two-component system, OmpR family, response regulator
VSRDGLSVLVVEDDADAAATYAAILGLSGHRPRVARDGGEALRRAAEDSPDVVLLDIGLPDLDGYRVAERLRSELREKPPFIVAVSGFGADGDRRRAREAGIDLHLTKPADPEALLGLLSRFAAVVARAASGPGG